MKNKAYILTLMLAVLLLTGCNLIDDAVVYDDTPVEVSLCLSRSSGQQKNTTRQSNKVVQEGWVRGILVQRIIPFAKNGKVESGDMPKFASIGGLDTYDKPKDATIPSSRFYYYENCSFMSGVSAFLVYGKAVPVSGGDAVNGALVADFPADQSPANIKFSPKQICNTADINNDIYKDARDIAEYLTAIANTEGWATTSDSHLQAYYQNFIGMGSVAPSVIAGSSANVKAYVTDLKNRITAEPESSLRTKILESIDNIDTHIPANYPGSISLPDGTSISLPDGAAALRWEIPAGETDEYAFVPQTVTTTEAPINSVTRFAYPAELYYYANSNIKTSYDEVSKSDYSAATDWSTLLDSKYKGSNTITPDTKAAAIIDPVQYAVARLDVKIKAESETLTDANGKSLTVTSNKFPLTAVIVGGQHTVGFDFTPIDNDDANVRFVYDNQVNTNTDNKPFYLSTTEQGPTHTLLLQSLEGKDVTVVLEFRNDSDTDFTGVDGIIYKGTKFYLVGQLILNEATGTDKTRVFTQDQKTAVTLKVSGLAKAYNVMPNLLSPRLEIGVTLTTQWEQVTPTVVVME